MFLNDQLIEEVNKYLSVMYAYVHMQNSNGLFDINRYCEDVVCGLLNLTYGISLVNLNNEIYNYPAVDLGDYHKRISFQVTSTNDVDKIRYTVNKFIENGLSNSFDQLNIFILGNKKNYRAPVETKGQIPFDIKQNVIDINDLSNMIYNLDQNRREAIYNYLKSTIMLNSTSSFRDKELYDMFTANIREYIKFIIEHDFSISPTNQNFMSDITIIINEWQLADRTFTFKILEQLKQKILFSLRDIIAYLSSPIYFQEHSVKGYIMPIRDSERIRYNEMSKNTNKLRKIIAISYQKMCNTYNSSI